MGGFVAAATAVAAPERVRDLVLVDGGMPGGATFPAADVAPDHHLERLLGPAAEAYVDSIEAEDIPDTNHYTILLGDRPATVVANRIRTLAT